MISLTLTQCSSQQAISHVEYSVYPDSPVSLPSPLTFPGTAGAPYMSEKYTKHTTSHFFVYKIHCISWIQTMKFLLCKPLAGLWGRWCPPAPPGVQTAPPGESASPGRWPTLSSWYNRAQTCSGQRCIWQERVISHKQNTEERISSKTFIRVIQIVSNNTNNMVTTC